MQLNRGGSNSAPILGWMGQELPYIVLQFPGQHLLLWVSLSRFHRWDWFLIEQPWRELLFKWFNNGSLGWSCSGFWKYWQIPSRALLAPTRSGTVLPHTPNYTVLMTSYSGCQLYTFPESLKARTSHSGTVSQLWKKSIPLVQQIYPWQRSWKNITGSLRKLSPWHYDQRCMVINH